MFLQIKSLEQYHLFSLFIPTKSETLRNVLPQVKYFEVRNSIEGYYKTRHSTPTS